mmetsp:Transcript_60111/g.105195  ORF Transcript_60111/g.105195 Transcript_60111/m.105195 type:complete len:242 (-) Transcript_60111:4169-4894(-)
MPKDEHSKSYWAHDVACGRTEQPEERLSCLCADNLFGVSHTSTELPEKWRQVGHQQPAIDNAAERRDDRRDSAARLSVDAHILIAKSLVHGAHGTIQQLSQSRSSHLGGADLLQPARHARRKMHERSHPALPPAAVEALSPLLSKKSNERRHKIQGHFIKCLGEWQRLLKCCFALSQVYDLISPRARCLHVHEGDTISIASIWRAHFCCRCVAMHGVITLFIDLPAFAKCPRDRSEVAARA